MSGCFFLEQDSHLSHRDDGSNRYSNSEQFSSDGGRSGSGSPVPVLHRLGWSSPHGRREALDSQITKPAPVAPRTAGKMPRSTDLLDLQEGRLICTFFTIVKQSARMKF
jgi:hypothetical protein